MNRMEIVRQKFTTQKEDSLPHDLANNYELTLYYFCHIVYYEPYEVAKRLKEYGAEKVCVYNYEEMQASLAEFDDYAIVAFRGIEKWDEFKIILRFWKKDFGKIRAHAGFVDSIKKISRSLIKDLEEIPRDKRIIFTGHSAGGALALLLNLHYKATEICTFGTPKVGGGEDYRAQFEGVKVIRVKTERDFVTWLPPTIPGLSNFEHIGETKVLPGRKNPYDSHKSDTYLKELIREKRYSRIDKEFGEHYENGGSE